MAYFLDKNQKNFFEAESFSFFLSGRSALYALLQQGIKNDAIANGISPEVLAKKYIKALKKNKREVWIGKKEVFAIYVKRFFPGLFARIIRNVKVT